MIYQWKVPGIVPVDAQVAGKELSRIYDKHGQLSPADIVNESRDESAPLHPCFEWDDAAAAEKYRESQAADIVRLICTVSEETQEPTEVRAFVHAQKAYHPIKVVLEDRDMREELLRTAMMELAAFQKKYNTLAELGPIFDAIEQVGRKSA